MLISLNNAAMIIIGNRAIAVIKSMITKMIIHVDFLLALRTTQCLVF